MKFPITFLYWGSFLLFKDFVINTLKNGRHESETIMIVIWSDILNLCNITILAMRINEATTKWVVVLPFGVFCLFRNFQSATPNSHAGKRTNIFGVARIKTIAVSRK